MSMAHPAKSEIGNFIIDLEDEECPNHQVHLAAYQNDTERLIDLLKNEEHRKTIDSKIRPFLATPLRLAATAGSTECIKLLLNHAAKIDEIDVKAQTPLFVAVVNQHWESARVLLEAGADPNGHDKNLCTPLAIMAQRGFYEGIRLLCQYGADTQDVFRLMTGLPGFPITITATYQHLKCFATLLVYGAEPDLRNLSHLNLPSYVLTQCSVPHAIIKYRCPPEFVYLYREFGGDLWIRDSRDRLATEISDSSPSLHLMKQLQDYPLSLQSCCRLSIRRSLGSYRLDKISQLQDFNLRPHLINFLEFREFICSTSQLPPNYDIPSLCRVSAVLKEISREPAVRRRNARTNEMIEMTKFIGQHFIQPTAEPQVNQQVVEHGQGVPPPPPPPPPPPRPGYWRFPEAEFANKIWHR